MPDGQELLTYETFNFPVPPALQWARASTYSGVVAEVHDLIALRLNRAGTTPGLLGAHSRVLATSDDAPDKVALALPQVIVLQRWQNESASTIVVYNWYEKEYAAYGLKNLPADGTWYVRFNGDSTKYSSQFGNYGANQTQIQGTPLPDRSHWWHRHVDAT